MTNAANEIITLHGKCSGFGGPNDTGVAPGEGLALVSDVHDPDYEKFFLASQPINTTGTARRLDSSTYYIACRWDYRQTPKVFLKKQWVTVTNAVTGKSAKAKPIDWGPNQYTGRVADLSYGLLTFLELETNDSVQVDIPLPQVVVAYANTTPNSIANSTIHIANQVGGVFSK